MKTNKVLNTLDTVQEVLIRLKSMVGIKKSTMFWLVYVALLTSMLEHTAWWFSNFQAVGSEHTAWFLAIVIEVFIFGFTHNIVGSIVKKTYDMIFMSSLVGILFSMGVSSLANFSYAVQFTELQTVYETNKFLQPLTHQIASGAMLPILAVVFSVVLAQSSMEEQKGEYELKYEEVKKLLATKENELKTSDSKLNEKEDRINQLSTELEKKATQLNELSEKTADFGAFSDIKKRANFEQVKDLFYSGVKKDRVEAAMSLFPDITPKTIALIAGVDSNYVHTIRNRNKLNGKNGKNGANGKNGTTTMIK